jgi:branched-chain amino acid transport system substrate-binding protein
MSPAGLDSAGIPNTDGGPVAGVYYTTVAGSAGQYPKARGFVEEYRQAFGKAAAPFAAQAYDATAIGLQAIEAAIKEAGGTRPTRGAVAKAIRKIKYAGLTGTVEFDDRGDPKRATYLVYQVGRDRAEARLVRRLEVEPRGSKAP